jgi:hypothetical protein
MEEHLSSRPMSILTGNSLLLIRMNAQNYFDYVFKILSCIQILSVEIPETAALIGRIISIKDA